MNKHLLTLMGGPRGGLRVPASVLHETIGALLEGARLATRFAVEGESIRKGPRPAWLDAACAIDITALSPGSAVFELEAPTLQDIDAAQFGADGQRSLFELHAHGFGAQTAVDLFGQVLVAVVEGQPDDVIADRALLDTCLRFAKIPGSDYDGVQLGGLRSREKPVVISRRHVAQIELLRDETPPPHATRLAGTLDTISASRSEVILTLKSGAKVPARLEDHDPDTLKELFGKHVVVSGVAHFRPSGRLLLLDVESITEATAGDRLFETAPVARKRTPVATPLTQDDSTGVSAFFGTWPGDESEDDLLNALQAIG